MVVLWGFNLQRDPKKSPRTPILMALFSKVLGYTLYNHLAYFLSYCYPPHASMKAMCLMVLISRCYQLLAFLDGDVAWRSSGGVYISNYYLFFRESSHVSDFNSRYKFLNANLYKQGYRYHKLNKAFSKFDRRRYELIEKYNVSLQKCLQQGISNLEFYGESINSGKSF